MGFRHFSKNKLNLGELLLLNELSNWAQLGLILKSCVCSLEWAQIELNCSIRLGDKSFRSYLLLMQKAVNGLYHPPILTWSCIKIRSAKHLNSFWTLIVSPNSVQNRQKNQSFLNFNPTSRYDTCGGGLGKGNQSPKGNMWSAIPVALLCMLVIVGDGKQGSGPKGDDVL